MIGNFKAYDMQYRCALSPHMVLSPNIANLRIYVEVMSNINTPFEQRQQGFNFNSIPGAIWGYDRIQDMIVCNPPAPNMPRLDEAGHPVLINDPLSLRIMNPDDIIPPIYHTANLEDDFLHVKSLIAKISRKLPKYSGKVEMVEVGNPGLLVSTIVNEPICIHNTADANGNYQYPHLEGSTREFYSSITIPDQSFMIGAYSLCGEITSMQPAAIYTEQEAIRAPNAAVQSADYEWLNLCSGILG